MGRKIGRRGVYLYSFKAADFGKVYYGNIYVENTENPDFLNPRFHEKRDPEKGWKYIVSCSFNEGEIKHSIFWLRKRDDGKAKKMFLEYLDKEIRKKVDDAKRMKERYMHIYNNKIEDRTKGE